MIELLKLSIISTVGIVGIVIIFGLFLGIIEKRTESNLYKKLGSKAIILTGIIGTTVHEFSHYIMCKIFLHKVTDVKFFSLKIKGNELGHVSHSYSKINPYQRVGNFFIGVAPILFGTFIIMFFLKLLLPNSFNNLLISLNLHGYISLAINFNFIALFSNLLKDSIIIVMALFSIENLLSFRFWIFLFIAVSISIHMSLSTADLKNSIDGILLIFIVSIITNLIFITFNMNIEILFSIILIYNIMLSVFLLFAIIFAIIAYIISSLIGLF